MLFKGISIVGHQPKWLFLRGLVGVISLGTFFMALQRIPMGSAISIRYLGPIFGTILAYFFFSEKPYGFFYLGAGFILMGIFMALMEQSGDRIK